MDNSQPLVSAIITTHNRAELLPRALDSVLVQTYENMEIVVVDDGSTDRTQEIIKEYQQQIPIKYLRLESSVGAPGARNKGIETAEGTFIAGLDDDDKWHEDRIKELVAAYSDEYSCVTSNVTMAYPNREKVWKKKKLIDLQTLLYTNQVGNQVLVRRERLLEVGGFDEELTASQDYDLWVRLCAAFGSIRNVQKPLQTVYMDHESGRISDEAWQGYLQFYRKHKARFSRSQRKYKLFNIRRAQQKPISFTEFLACVPPFRYWKEIKLLLIRKFLK